MLRVKIQEPKKIIYENIEEPIAKAGEAVLRITASGICGSDMHIYLGENPGIKPPHISGWECLQHCDLDGIDGPACPDNKGCSSPPNEMEPFGSIDRVGVCR